MRENDLRRVFVKIEPDVALKGRIINRIDHLEDNNMKHASKKGIRRTVVIAACITAVSITTVFAAGNIISYFQSEKSVELTDMNALSRYNEEVGVTASNHGYTLTIDNLATDDNFMHVFYTLKQDNGFTEQDGEKHLWFICRINGQVANFGNHNEEYGYLSEDGSYKGVLKLNIASMKIPETFKFEMYSAEGSQLNGEFEGDYLYRDGVQLTESDISKLLYVSTTANKSSVKTKSIVRNIHRKFSVPYYDKDNNLKTGEAEISKVVFSPFGNQIIVKDKCKGAGATSVSGWALFDENGKSLDILNTDFTGSPEGAESTNAIEFLKADINTKYLKFVPMKQDTYEFLRMNTQAIGTYPLTFKVNRYGNVVVTDVRITDGKIEIDYFKDGFSSPDPDFKLLDKEGNKAESLEKHGCLQTTRVHHNTNSYTIIYEYYTEYDESGNKVPFEKSSVSKENLEKQFTQIGIGEYEFMLDYDNAIDMNLK